MNRAAYRLSEILLASLSPLYYYNLTLYGIHFMRHLVYKTLFGVVLNTDQALLVQEHFQSISLLPEVFEDGHWSLPDRAALMGAGADSSIHWLNGMDLENPFDRLDAYVFGIFLRKDDVRHNDPIHLSHSDQKLFQEALVPVLRALDIPLSTPLCRTLCQFEEHCGMSPP